MKSINCLAFLSCLLFVSCYGAKPNNLGVKDGNLTPCPGSPNCVSSQSENEKHKIEPLLYKDSQKEAKDKILDIIRSMDRTRIVVVKDNYIHAEFKSFFWRFIDDVEFYFLDQKKIIHVRSASRVGNYDFGVNRKRIEKIREKFNSVDNP